MANGRPDGARPRRALRGALRLLPLIAPGSLVTRLLILGALTLAYAGTFVLFAPQVGLRLGVLSLLIIVPAALFFGLWGGLGAGLLCLPLNTGLFNIVGAVGWDSLVRTGNLFGALACALIGAVLGLIRDLGVELVGEIERRKRSEKNRRMLAAFIVHDLKSPLAAVVSNANYLLQETTPGDEPHEAARDILETAETMHRMVLNILDVGRGDEGALRAERREADLVNLVKEAISHHRSYLLEGIHMEVSLNLEPRRARVDPELLRRLVDNLVDNALKYSPTGSTVRVKATWHAPHELEIKVSDEGPGIPPSDRQRVFEKYTRLDTHSGTHANRSRGMGLPFCRLAALAHGGTIWIEDNHPRGSSFCVRLPAPTSAEAEAAIPVPVPPETSSAAHGL